MSEENKEIKDVEPLEAAGGKRKKGIFFAFAVGLLILIATIFMILVMPNTADARKVQEQLKLGAKYLSELNYEQAIAAYQAAIEIEPKCTEAYLGLADIYTELGEFAKAEEILAEAKKYIEDEGERKKIEEKEKEVEEEKKATEVTPIPTPTVVPTLESTATPTPEPTATPTPEPTGTPIPTQTKYTLDEIGKAGIGDYVMFGSYEQDNVLTNGTEVIEWQVLDKKDGKVLLLSKYALDAKPYHEEWADVTWETCTLRSWLNGEFYNTAFDSNEQKYIAETYIVNEDNPNWGTEGGNSTYDKVFLLSIGEVTTYFDSDLFAYDPARRAKVTEYAKAQGAWWYNYDGEYYGNAWWWLRSPGYDNDDAAGVYNAGYVDHVGHSIDFNLDVVRPALWIKVEESEKPTPEPTVTPTSTSELTITPTSEPTVTPTLKPTSTPKPTATLKPTATPKPTEVLSASREIVDLKDAYVGASVLFGSYEQDNDLTNGKEAIEWRVLDVQDGKALLLSEYALDNQQYNEGAGMVTWETSALRVWLNAEFYNKAFKTEEQATIALVTIKNPENPEYKTDGGNETQDHIFVLSIEEAEKYFTEDEARVAFPTAYTVAQGTKISSSGNCYWWLRSPGQWPFYATSVTYSGRIDKSSIVIEEQDGNMVRTYYAILAVRPALWVNMFQ